MQKSETCISCGSSNIDVIKQYHYTKPSDAELDTSDYYSIRRHMLFHKICLGEQAIGIDIALCSNCGMMFSNPRFTPDEIARKYGTDEADDDGSSRPQVPELRNRDAVKAREKAEFIGDLFEKYLTTGANRPKEELKILDYGGGDGVNIMPLAEKAYPSYLLDYVARPMQEGVTRLGRDFSDIDENMKFDGIMLCHTLEHVSDPKPMVHQLADKLADEGLLYIEVPLGCWMEWRTSQEPVTHVNYFSEQSVAWLMEDAGLDIVYANTRLQYACSSRLLCVVMLGRKTSTKANVKVRTTRSQMKQPYYEARYKLATFVRKLRGG